MLTNDETAKVLGTIEESSAWIDLFTQSVAARIAASPNTWPEDAVEYAIQVVACAVDRLGHMEEWKGACEPK